MSAIVYYELTRELLRVRRSSIDRINSFIDAIPNCYIPLSDAALRLAAELWAESRQRGRPTADSRELDVDVILAAQALTFGSSAGTVVATTNTKHLAQFLPAKRWQEILA